MPTAYFYSGTDRSIGGGTWNYYFNPTGDVSGAEAEDVRFRFFISYDGGNSVDLGDVDIYLVAPDGDRDHIYYNWDGFGNDGDDNNDSDASDDYDISFWGSDSKSTTDDLSGAQVNGTWRLEVKNDTGKTLDLYYLEVWVDYKTPEDYTVSDIRITGTQQVGQPVIIEATIANVGQLYDFEYVTIEYLVNGEVIGTSALTAGLLAGATNVETELHTFDFIGNNEVTVRIAGSPDYNTSNNSRTETFYFAHNDPDLAVTDIRVTGDGEAGSTHYISADVTNVGNATHFGDVLLEYLVDGQVIGTQTIGGAGVNTMLPGTENTEIEAHFISDVGATDIQVRIANPSGSDYSSSNNSRTEVYTFTAPDEAPDLAVTDVRVIGGWSAGDEVNLRAHIENNGDEGWNALAGFPQVEYFVRYSDDGGWLSVGTDGLTAALVSGWSEWEDVTFTLAQDGPFEVKVEITGDDYESNTANNSWSEHAGHNRDSAAQKNLENSASDVLLATFLARAVYGMSDIPDDFRQNPVADDDTNGLFDDYTGYLDEVGFTVLTDRDFGDLFRPLDETAQFFGGVDENGIYTGGLYAGDRGLIPSSDPTKWQAQGLVAEGYDADGNKTLTLTFRGTDPDDAIEAAVGQAWTGDGLYDYYESMRPLIDAALAYANDDANGIEKFLVAGHSLGGSTADAFSYVDAHRLKGEIELTVVSIASAGLDANMLTDTYVFRGMEGQHDPNYDLFNGLSLHAKPFYIGVSHEIDAVTYPFANPLNPVEKVVNSTLLTNMSLDDKLTAIHTPNNTNDDRPGYNFGAGHNTGLYWANLSQIMLDPLKDAHAGHRISVGVSDFSQIKDLNGQTFAVFDDYAGHDEHDNGTRALIGDGGRDFMLGFSGDDELIGYSGDDLLSGGLGNDTLRGGKDNDIIHGGEGDDFVTGGSGDDDLEGADGDDTLDGGSDDDSLTGGAGQDSLIGGTGADTLNGGEGQDSLIGGKGSDVLDGGIDHDSLLGFKGADELIGGLGNDILKGGRGYDSLIAGEGDDNLYGGWGRDTMEGGTDNDTLSGGRDHDLLFGQLGDDSLLGGGGTDTLFGGEGNDSLSGESGADRLLGGAGSDTLNGGGGTDTFVFALDDGADLIEDFADDYDTLEFDTALWTGTLSAADLLTTFATADVGGVVFDFGNGDVLTLTGLTDTTVLENDIAFA